MIKRLDRYVLSEFLAPLGLITLGVASLFLLVDVVDSLPRLREWKAPWHLIALYHLFHFPYVVAQVLPLGVMLASLIALGNLARGSELTAARAGGISVARLGAPILVMATLLSALLFGASELLLPKTNYYARYIKKALIEKRDLDFDRPWKDHMAKSLSKNRNLYALNYDAHSAVARSVVMARVENGRVLQRIDAERLAWNQNQWEFQKGVERIFDAQGELVSERNFTEWPLDIDEKPNDFMMDEGKRDEDVIALSIAELDQVIAILKNTGSDTRREQVCRQIRYSYPLACLVLALLGISLPFLFPHGRRAMTGAAIGTVASILTAMLYLVFTQVGLSLGKNGQLPITISAWIANLVFTLIGAIALWRANR